MMKVTHRATVDITAEAIKKKKRGSNDGRKDKKVTEQEKILDDVEKAT